MKEKVIKLLLDKPIAINPVLVKLCGLNGGYVLSQAIYWEKTMGREFYKTQVDWQNELNISRHELATGVKNASKYLKVIRKSVPAKNYYHIDWDALLQDLGQLDIHFTDNKISRKQIASDAESGQHTYTETTTETNAENNNSSFVNSLIKEMTVIDPKNKNYYKNKTQREACNFLIREYGSQIIKIFVNKNEAMTRTWCSN